MSTEKEDAHEAFIKRATSALGTGARRESKDTLFMRIVSTSREGQVPSFCVLSVKIVTFSRFLRLK